MKRTLFSLITLFALAACSDESPVALNDVDTFSRQLTGQWELEKVDITPVHTTKSVDIAPSKEYACNQLSTAFESRDVVSKFCIRFNDGIIKVSKFYTCSLPPEQLSWKVKLDNTVDKNVNWMSGKTFTINEVNEASVQATYKLLFFNLEGDSPNGEKATQRTANQLWLDVKYDTKESSQSFILKLKKVK
ncbi:MAG: hypothetical protein ABIS36_09375 [Chryseolinea sp.]